MTWYAIVTLFESVVVAESILAARDGAHERRGFRTGQQTDIVDANALEAIEFAYQALAAAGQGRVAEIAAVPHIRADVNYAWPTAEIAVMGAEGAVNISRDRALARKKAS